MRGSTGPHSLQAPTHKRGPTWHRQRRPMWVKPGTLQLVPSGDRKHGTERCREVINSTSNLGPKWDPLGRSQMGTTLDLLFSLKCLPRTGSAIAAHLGCTIRSLHSDLPTKREWNELVQSSKDGSGGCCTPAGGGPVAGLTTRLGCLGSHFFGFFFSEKAAQTFFPLPSVSSVEPQLRKSNHSSVQDQ